MATRKQRLALPRKPLDCWMTRLCFCDANLRFCCALLFRTNVDGVTLCVTEDSEFGMKLPGKITGSAFLVVVETPFPRRRSEGGDDTDLAIVITIAETPLLKPAGAILAVRPSDGTNRCAI